MKTILFYGRDGAKAKERAKEIRKSKGRVVIYDVAMWEGGKDGADSCVIMDCVSYFDRERIEYVFGKSDAESIGPIVIPISPIAAAKIHEDGGVEVIAPTRPVEFVEEKQDIRIPKKRGRKPKVKVDA